MSWKRKLNTHNGKDDGKYSFQCDGTEFITGQQAITCMDIAPGRVEGYEKPPLSYYVRQVTGDTLTITRFKDAKHVNMTSSLVYTRLP